MNYLIRLEHHHLRLFSRAEGSSWNRTLRSSPPSNYLHHWSVTWSKRRDSASMITNFKGTNHRYLYSLLRHWWVWGRAAASATLFDDQHATRTSFVLFKPGACRHAYSWRRSMTALWIGRERTTTSIQWALILSMHDQMCTFDNWRQITSMRMCSSFRSCFYLYYIMMLSDLRPIEGNVWIYRWTIVALFTLVRIIAVRVLSLFGYTRRSLTVNQNVSHRVTIESSTRSLSSRMDVQNVIIQQVQCRTQLAR